MNGEPEWFAPKRYGYGAGLPISWQGWVLLLGYVAVVTVLGLAWARHPLQIVAALIPLTIAFVVICARTTKGGWRWRWGEEE